jgi:hypothetical protein
MDNQTVAALANRMASDAALQRAMVAQTDITKLAQWLTKLDEAGEASLEDWTAWLSTPQSLRDLPPPTWQMGTAPPAAWMPVRLFETQGEWQVEWVHALFAPLSDPFFDDSATRIRRHPANLILSCSTPVAALAEFAGCDQPDIVVFHISRCGSTLVARMFGAMDQTRVLAEPPVLDQAIQLYLRGLIDADLVRGLAGALGREPQVCARRRVIKLDSWHCLALDRIADVFPFAHKLLLIRDPVEVLVSHRENPGMQVLKGAVPFDTFGLVGMFEAPQDEFPAWVIAAIMRGALQAADRPDLLVCDYADLPGAFTGRILPHCRIDLALHEADAITQVAGYHSKRPDAPFLPDGALRQEAADPALRASAARHDLPQLYTDLRLRAARKAH